MNESSEKIFGKLDTNVSLIETAQKTNPSNLIQNWTRIPQQRTFEWGSV